MRAPVLLLAFLWAATAHAQPATPGRLAERVACAADPARTYALYLPSAYTRERKWPIVYVFDSRGHGRELAELFRAGAERFGWVVASSYDSSNLGPMEPNFAIMSALWADTHARLALDDRRVYAAGFSGMSRFATMLGLTAPGSLAGVIGLNGGFPLGRPPTRETPFPFFGTVGNLDFSYYEILDLEGQLAAAGVPHRIEVFAGSHEWPPAELATRALAWMELQAMKKGTREKSPALVEELWQEDLARAKAHEAGGRSYEAWRAYQRLAADFAGLRETADAAAKATALGSSEAVRSAVREREARDRRDREYLERAPRVLHAAETDLRPEAVSRLLAELGVPDLKRQAEAADPAERLSAERRLYAVYIQSGLYLPRSFSERGNHDRAIFFLEVAGQIDPDVPHIPYRMAVAYARKGNPKKALEALARAADLGWDDPAALEREEAFASLRDSEEFKKVVARARAAELRP